MVGPKSIRYHAPLDRLPLFVKADSIIPMGPEMSYVGEKPFDPITLDIYLYDRAKFTMYDDEQVLFKGERGPKAITFEISNSTKSYILRFNNTPCPARVRVNKKDLNRFLTRDELGDAAEGWFFDPSGVVEIKLSSKGRIFVTLDFS